MQPFFACKTDILGGKRDLVVSSVGKHQPRPDTIGRRGNNMALGGISVANNQITPQKHPTQGGISMKKIAIASGLKEMRGAMKHMEIDESSGPTGLYEPISCRSSKNQRKGGKL
jgi:hypothetical protein